MKEKNKGYMQGIAKETLDTFATIAEQARHALANSPVGIRPEQMTDFNVATDGNTLRGIQRFNQEKCQGAGGRRRRPIHPEARGAARRLPRTTRGMRAHVPIPERTG